MTKLICLINLKSSYINNYNNNNIILTSLIFKIKLS